MIPSVLHLIWVGSRPPVDVQQRWQAWIDMHPHWTIRIWTDDDLHNTASSTLGIDHPVLFADFLRIEKVLLLGGVYVDSDTWPLKPLDPLTGDRQGWVSTIRTDPLLLNNAAFGFPPGHHYLSALWTSSSYRHLNKTHSRLNYIAGPPLWTKVYSEHFTDEIDVLNPQAFTPITHGPAARRASRDLARVASDYPDAYSIHEFAQAWQKGHR